MRNDFAILILTHGRPDNIKTLSSLKRAGYTGKYYIVIDNEDEKANEYYNLYGDKVIMFDKQAISDNPNYDKFDNNNNKKVIYFARNAAMEIAKDLGLKYYMQFDDDYKDFMFRFEKDGTLKYLPIENIDKVINLLIDFLNNTKALSVCMSQGGDHLGGVNRGIWKTKLKRKAMNSFLVDVDRSFKFYGRINEDVNTYTMLGNRGELFFTIADIQLNQAQTQTNAGGMTDIYLDSGTYVKSFYSVICSPQAVKISMMGDTQMRIHHKVYWNYCVPKIINEKYKKL